MATWSLPGDQKDGGMGSLGGGGELWSDMRSVYWSKRTVLADRADVGCEGNRDLQCGVAV